MPIAAKSVVYATIKLPHDARNCHLLPHFVTPLLHSEAYAALPEVPKSITADLKTFTKDPAPIEAYRNRVAKAIEKPPKDL